VETVRGGRLRRLALALSLGAVAALAITSATAAHVDAGDSGAAPAIRLLTEYPKVILIPGANNKTCDELDENGSPGASWSELKFDAGDLPSVGESATKADSYLSVTLTRTATDTWSWTSTKGVDAVFVKSGASGSNLYLYDPPLEATSGSGLTVPGQNGTSHVAFCYDEETTPPPPAKGNLKVVKLIVDAPAGVGFDDFSFAIDGGAAVSFDADGVSDEYTFDAGTSHNVIEPQANGTGFTTSYSDECSDGTIVANQTITCTITNAYAPGGHEPPAKGKLKVVKVIQNTPVGVGFDDFSFAIDGGAAVSFDADGVSDEYTFDAGMSHNVIEPQANGTGFTTSYSDECSDGTIVANQTITCTITNAYAPGGENPPPPPPPTNPPPSTTVQTDEFMDVQVIKDATPQVQLVNGQAEIAYTVRVRNQGPNQAHDVKLVDAAPSGVTFLAVTQQPVGGTCSLSGSVLLQCSLGTLGPGVERTIGVSARVTQTGTYVNSATGTGQGKDTNGANNTDDASTLVTAPVTPPVATPSPKPKPKPPVKPAPEICRILKVTPGLVQANGKRQLVLAKVTRSKTPVKGVAVRFSGTGPAKIVKTNAKGVARLAVTPNRAGIMIVRITSAKACNTARIGVVGVFEPPVTG
jgi:uncharacterized repeat protein (TIGR01451 family)